MDQVPVPVQKSRSRRGAVSGSVMTEEQATSYVKKVLSWKLRREGGRGRERERERERWIERGQQWLMYVCIQIFTAIPTSYTLRC